MLSRSFLVHHIMLTNRDFKEHIQPLPPPVHLGQISEEELKQVESKKMAIKGQIYHISQSRSLGD
uniref:Putative ovule protein n=1 Tax=Solanum chacoense TaxID=4108 RepID=A0A0V0GM27_SOLCH